MGVVDLDDVCMFGVELGEDFVDDFEFVGFVDWDVYFVGVD